MTNWEYALLALDDPDDSDALCHWILFDEGDDNDESYPRADVHKEVGRLGREGWELVSVQLGGHMYFKRPLPDA